MLLLIIFLAGLLTVFSEIEILNNPLTPDNKILALPKFEAFADDSLNVAQLVHFFSDRVENIVGKGENVGY